MTTINILEKYPANAFLYFLNDDDAINSAFSHALEHYEFPFPFRGEIAYKMFEHFQIQRTGILTVRTKNGEINLNDLDKSMKLALLIGENIGSCGHTFISLNALIYEPMRWLSQNYDLTLHCLYDDVESCPGWMKFDEHIKFVHNGETVPDLINYRFHSCTFTRSKEAQSFEKHFGNKLFLKHDHLEQYVALKEEVDIDEYATPYIFRDLLDELDLAEGREKSPDNPYYTYTVILSGGSFCFDRITKVPRIYLLSICADYVYGRLKMYKNSTNGDILRKLESIYEGRNSDRLTAIIADGNISAKNFADDYIPHIQYGVEIDFATRTVYILDPTSAAVRFHNALQDSFITEEQHPYIYWQY